MSNNFFQKKIEIDLAIILRFKTIFNSVFKIHFVDLKLLKNYYLGHIGFVLLPYAKL